MVLSVELFLSTLMYGLFDIDMPEAEKPNSVILRVRIKGFGVWWFDSRDVSRRFPECLVMCVGMSKSLGVVFFHTSGIFFNTDDFICEADAAKSGCRSNTRSC